jgi:hypothetical protein
MKININANASSSHHVVLRGIGDDFGGAVGGKAGSFPGFFLGFFLGFFSGFFSDSDAMKYPFMVARLIISDWCAVCEAGRPCSVRPPTARVPGQFRGLCREWRRNRRY